MNTNNPQRNNMSRTNVSASVMKKGVNTFLTPAQTLAKRGVIYDDYDEPTYVGFYVKFDFIGPSSPLVPGNYDYMPEGLLGNSSSPYSAENYLRSIDEHHRADMIKAFNSLLHSISENTPHYIQEIEGLDSIFKINTENNFRGSEAQLKLKLLDGIDMRTTALIDLYKRVAWDSTWMRWILPDIHRYFSMKIYITEFRNFHVPRGKERSGMGKIDSGGSNSSNITDSFGNAYNSPGGYPLNSAVQGYKDQLNDLRETASELTKGIGTIPPAARDRFSNSEQTNTNSSKHFLSALGRNLSVLVLDLKQCEISLEEMNAPYGDSISNTDAGDALEHEITIKVGKIKEVSEYSLLSVGLQGILDSSDPTIRAGIFSDDAIDTNWSQTSSNNTVTPTDNDLYNMITGDYSSEDIESSYNSENSPFGRGHLKNDDRVRTLGENLLEGTETRLISEVDNFVRTHANKALLGNVYGFSTSTLANRLSSDPHTWGTAIVDIIRKTQTPEAAESILENIYSNLPSPSDRLGNDPGNIGLTGQNSSQSDPGNIGLTGPSSSQSDPGNIGLTGPSSSISDPGNIGLTGPSSSISDPGNIGLTGPSSSISDPGNIGLTGPSSSPSDPGNVGLTGTSNTQNEPGNVGLTGASSSPSDPGNIGLSGNEQTEASMTNIGLTGPSSSPSDPGNIGLSGKEKDAGRNLDNIGLTGANVNNDIPTNIGLTGIDNPRDIDTKNVGLTGPVPIDNISSNIGLTGVGKSNNELSNIGLTGNDVKPDALHNIGLSGKDTSIEMDNENIGYTDTDTNNDSVLGNIGLTGTKIDTPNVGNIGLTGATVTSDSLGNIGLSGKDIETTIDENIGLTGTDINKENPGNINYSGKEPEKSTTLGNAGLSGDYLRSQVDENIGLTGSSNTPTSLKDKNIGLSSNKPNEENLGSINLTGNEANIDDEVSISVGLTGHGTSIDDNKSLPNNKSGREHKGHVE